MFLFVWDKSFHEHSANDVTEWVLKFCGLYYKPMMIVNDDSRVINKLEASLTDDARVVIYDCHMFIVQATDLVQEIPLLQVLWGM